MQITSKHRQWLGDIAVREGGNIATVVEMAIKNNRSITDRMAVGSNLLKSTPMDRRVMNYYKINNIYPATELYGRFFSGIGYMEVEATFIVS